MMMRTLALVMLVVALPRLSYAAEDEGVSHALLDKIACKMRLASRLPIWI